MKVKARAKPIVPAADITDKEVDSWVRKNKESINLDLAAARKGLRAGQGRTWDFAKFVARARKRSAAKKK